MLKVIPRNNDMVDIVNKAPVFPGGMGASRLIADPFLSGWAFVIFTNVPKQIAKLTSPNGDESDLSFFRLMEMSFKELSGINDLDLGTSSVSGGFTGNEYHFPNEINKNCNEVTLKFQELSGNVFSGPFQNWITSILDPETGVSSLENFAQKEYSVEFLYFTCNPGIGTASAEGRKRSLESAFYFTNGFPKRVALSQHNFSSNSHDTFEIDQPFSVNMHLGSKIFELAKKVVSTEKFYENFIQKQHEFITDNRGNAFNGLPEWLVDQDLLKDLKGSDSTSSTIGGNIKKEEVEENKK